MAKCMHTIALVPNLEKPEAKQTTQETAALLQRAGAEVLLPEELAGVFAQSGAVFCSEKELYRRADCVTAIGGDGTIIHTAKRAAMDHTPVVGVNVGTLGYVAGVERNETDILCKLLQGDYQTEQRMMLEVTHHVGDRKNVYTALNDVIVSCPLSKIVDFTVSIQGQAICRYRADGIIFSTPTGSTAYALSAGGPVIEPTLQMILLTPVCPHALFARPVLFGSENRLFVRASTVYEEGIFLTTDGEDPIPVQKDDCVEISRSETTVELLVLKAQHFYNTLYRKLAH